MYVGCVFRVFQIGVWGCVCAGVCVRVCGCACIQLIERSNYVIDVMGVAGDTADVEM